jgi:hypothetical protein
MWKGLTQLYKPLPSLRKSLPAPDILSRHGCLGAQLRLGWGRQNERDRVMVEDPLTDFEEVVSWH